ncbi:MAG TPA: NAD-dependent succinate-semialdehyde dehydrogenase [Opitutales bacterium]|jgi:succinate-semialdehyde dehydrogenase/glutarate-semialdehyde dehydrogenase|nr:NAD-dependent succinate-semialdehyde dehydrogenase [Opitutales bacterium]
MLRSVNPATGELTAEFQPHSISEINAAVVAAHTAFEKWRRVKIEARAEKLQSLAKILREQRDHCARIATEEMGKPITEARAEIEKCAWVCEYYAEHGPAMLADAPVKTEARESFVTFQPLGVVLAVMPWNFPFWQFFRAAAPILVGGNALVLKHASNVPRCALAIAHLFRETDFPPDLVRVILAGPEGAGATLKHDLICGVTLTGSNAAGMQIAALAGGVLKKCVMELGGSDPYLILEDADLALAAKLCAQSRCNNAGQTCIAAKRFIVLESVRDAFTEKLLHELRAYAPGNPLDPATKLGPLARADVRDSLQKQVETSIAAGAKLLLGGAPLSGPGNFYPPTVLTNVSPGMAAFDEETFGPVAAIISAQDESEAIALANRHHYGLGAGIFTRDLARGRRLAREELAAGACTVNDFVKSDPRLPFGGVKQSGYGRELGLFGAREFVNIKSVVVQNSNPPA